MSKLREAANELSQVYEDYFLLSEVLKLDLDKLLDEESDSQIWRKNFVCTSWPMIEAYSNTPRNLCSVLDKHSEFDKSKRQRHLLANKANFSSVQRIKETLKLAFKIYELDEKPVFGDQNWQKLQKAVKVRNSITLPNSSNDLQITDKDWGLIYEGIIWLMRELFSFFDQVHSKYGPRTIQAHAAGQIAHY